MLLALSTLPAAAYLLIERGLLRGNTTVMGARYKIKDPSELEGFGERY